MATIKEIKTRKRSIESTSKITKAMKLVASAKLQKTKDKAISTIPYFDTIVSISSNVLSKSENIRFKYSQNPNADKKKALIVMSSNKGLAGGYNSSIIKEIFSNDAGFNKDDTLIYAMGTKARDILKSKGYDIYKDYSDDINTFDFNFVKKLSDDILTDYVDGKVDSIYMCFTIFKNTMVHIPTIMKMLPISNDDMKDFHPFDAVKGAYEPHISSYANDEKMIMNYEPSDDEMLNMLIPKYISSCLFSAWTTSLASENGARMTAMDSATKNANDLIDKLGVEYNRARQGAITQELTEIIAGANAI